MMHGARKILNSLVLLLLATSGQLCVGQVKVEIQSADGKVSVSLDGEPFTEYVFAGHTKPILYPIIGPHGISMTRHYPMRKEVDNEASDHVHHQSLWFTHDGVNGFNFWSSNLNDPTAPTARIVQTEMAINDDTLTTADEWRAPSGDVVCTDSRQIRFGADDHARFIDHQITIHASHGDVTFADTKEGTMAIRTHPRLRITSDAKRGNHTAVGHATNSEGDRDAKLWGKRAKWVDYWGDVNGHTVGIAIFDHPKNPRHPTWWHARTYGLVAANPFGIHDFENKPAGTGELVVKQGDSVTFRHRFLFHEGDAEAASIEAHYQRFAED